MVTMAMTDTMATMAAMAAMDREVKLARPELQATMAVMA